MQTRTATALSLVGVLAAGTAAALANTQVLNSRAQSNASPNILTVNAVADTVPAPAKSPIAPSGAEANDPADSIAETPRMPLTTRQLSSAPTNSRSMTTMPVPTTVQPSPASSDQTALRYSLGDAGRVELQTGSAGLRIVRAEPLPGWRVVSSTTSGDATAVVLLRSSTVEVTFTASLVDGRVVTDVTSRSLTSTGTAGGGDVDVDVEIDRDEDDYEEEYEGDEDEDEDDEDDEDEDDEDDD